VRHVEADEVVTAEGGRVVSPLAQFLGVEDTVPAERKNGAEKGRVIP